MVHHGRVELLAHPLSQKYLEMKWNSYGKYFHMTHLVLYLIFLTFVTVFTSQLMSTKPECEPQEPPFNPFNSTAENCLLTRSVSSNLIIKDNPNKLNVITGFKI